MKVFAAAAMALFTAAALGCTKEDSAPAATTPASTGPTRLEVSPEEAKAIAENAYLYAFPLLESYRRLYAEVIDRTDPSYLGPLNELVQVTDVTDDDGRLRTDVLESTAWLDLRAQPMVLTVPATDDRYRSVEIFDFYGQRIGLVRANQAGSHVIAGPAWDGVAPSQATAVHRSGTSFVLCIVRIELQSARDREAATRVQSRFALSTLSGFTGGGLGPDAAGITFPSYDQKRAESAAFLDLFNFVLATVSTPNQEQALISRFAEIGVEPGAQAASLALSTRQKYAVDAGVARAIGRIASASLDPSVLEGVGVGASNQWLSVEGLFGRAPRTPPDYLARAVAAKLGLGESASSEIARASTAKDSRGNSLDAQSHDYVLRFDAAELPKVAAFWSIAIQAPPSRPFVRNRSVVFAVADRGKLRVARDGSITFAIQRQRPPSDGRTNWLPAPPGPFSIEVSSYAPKREPSAGPYLPPAVKRSN